MKDEAGTDTEGHFYFKKRRAMHVPLSERAGGDLPQNRNALEAVVSVRSRLQGALTTAAADDATAAAQSRLGDRHEASVLNEAAKTAQGAAPSGNANALARRWSPPALHPM